MNKREIYTILLLFFIWKLFGYVFADLSKLIFTLHVDFVGGGLLNYLRQPFFWGFVNFDGQHYLSIARDGYLPLTYFYFPLFPLTIKLFSILIGKSFLSYAFSGLVISNILFLVSIFGIYKLGKLFFDSNVAILSIVLLILFPTSFFFASYYNESMFLALVVWGIYFSLKKKWLLAFFLSGLATSTRLVGLALSAALVYEYVIENNNRLLSIRTFFYSTLSTIGIIVYSFYLQVKTGDFLAFIHNIEIFGAQRSSKIVLLPQVFYRYIFKILPAVNYSYIPQSYVTILEILTALAFLGMGYFVFIKMKKSFFIYYITAYLIPTFSGSFSSLPRYVLILFPGFLLAAYYLRRSKNRLVRYVLFSLLLFSNFLAVSLFIRGYFVA